MTQGLSPLWLAQTGAERDKIPALACQQHQMAGKCHYWYTKPANRRFAARRDRDMGRPAGVAGGRPVVLTIKLSKEEAAAFDRARQGLSRSAAGRVAINRFSSDTHRAVPVPDKPYIFPEDV